MTIKLYDRPASPPCRAVKFALKALNLDYEVHLVDVINREHHSASYTEMNPQHTFPVLIDDGFIVCDSHAINGYLIDKYGEDDSLYSKDPKQRAVIDQRMYFECSVIFPSIKRILRPIVLKERTTVDENEVKLLKEAYEFVEKFLARGTQYIAGNHITIADYSFVTTLTTTNSLLATKLDIDEYPLTKSYLDRCAEDLPGYKEINETGLEEFKKSFMKYGVFQ